MVTVTRSPKRKTLGAIKLYFLETRPHYLLLPVVLILVGTGIAVWQNHIYNIGYALLALVGLIFCHSSVNIINDYYDFRSGVDLKTIKTPFNGGSGLLPAGKIKSKNVLIFGLVCLIVAVPIGVFFTIVQGWQLLPLLMLGAICILFYTTVILKTHFPEWSPGVGLGLLPVLGAYFVQTGGYSWMALIGSVPSGFLVLNLLLLNEFPDADADLTARKKTLPITVGKKNAAIVYTTFVVLTYLWIVSAVITRAMPAYCLLALATLPFAYKAVRGSFGYWDLGKIIPAMGNNVIVVLLLQALLGTGYILAAIF
jgi:1,4-dihydroxy-2-naphthoate polyprenyltransferase